MEGLNRVHHSDDVRFSIYRVVYSRRSERRIPRGLPIRLPTARHLLHSCPHPLRLVWWFHRSDIRRYLLLVPKNHGKNAGRNAWQVKLLANLHWNEPNVLPNAFRRPQWHAPTDIHLLLRIRLGAHEPAGQHWIHSDGPRVLGLHVQPMADSQLAPSQP